MSKLRKVGIGLGIFIGIILVLGVIGSTVAKDQTSEIGGNSQSNELQEAISVNTESSESSPSVETTKDVSSTESMRACIPDRVCFVSGDYLLYQTFNNGTLEWETKYTYEGTFDSPEHVAVHKYDRSYFEGAAMIVGGKTTNNVTSLEDFNLCCGLQSEAYVGAGAGYRYEVIQPSPVKIERWLEHETSTDYWTGRVKPDTYNWNGFDRSVIVIQDGDSIRQVIDKETGILLLLENNQTRYDGWFRTMKLMGTNIIKSDSDSGELPTLKVIASPSKYSIARGSEQTIFVKVTDESGKPIEGVAFSAVVTYASGAQQFFTGESDASGSWNFSWQIGGNSITGTFTVNVNAAKSGYSGDTASSFFSVTQAG